MKFWLSGKLTGTWNEFDLYSFCCGSCDHQGYDGLVPRFGLSGICGAAVSFLKAQGSDFMHLLVTRRKLSQSKATGAVDLKLHLRWWLLLTSSKLLNLSQVQLLNMQSRNVFLLILC